MPLHTCKSRTDDWHEWAARSRAHLADDYVNGTFEFLRLLDGAIRLEVQHITDIERISVTRSTRLYRIAPRNEQGERNPPTSCHSSFPILCGLNLASWESTVTSSILHAGKTLVCAVALQMEKSRSRSNESPSSPIKPTEKSKTNPYRQHEVAV